MLFQLLRCYQFIWQHLHYWVGFPYVTLLFWILPLLLFNSGHSSLMAHDEGLYAWRSRQILDSGDWINPWSQPHHKTPGPYWLIASSYTLFGISEASVRLPSMILGILSVIILYEIGKILLDKKIAWLASAILSVEFLWLQYCRLGTPDVPMIFLILLAILALLKAESNPQYCYFYTFLVGVCFGLGFFVRSFMIFLPMIAFFPYLVWEHSRHRHLTNPMLYLGFLLGLTPTFIWLWLNFSHYGSDSVEELLRFVFRLGSKERSGNGILFYLWNLPIKAFPWFFFGLLGLFVAWRRPIPRYHLILVGLPLVLFFELSLFSTRLPHYSLSLYPFIALLAAVGLDWLGSVGFDGETSRWEEFNSKFSPSPLPYGKPSKAHGRCFMPGNPSTALPRLHPITPSQKPRFQKLFCNLSYGFGVLAILLLLMSILAFIWGSADIRKYATVGLALGCGWLILPLVWIGRYRFGKKFLNSNYWLTGWLIPAWLALAVAGSNGFLSDYNPHMRTFLAQPAIAHILQNHSIHFVKVGGKTGVLLDFYTPHHGEDVQQISELPVYSYAWISAKQATNLSTPHRVLGTVQQYQLIQVLP
ncbi:glycosyltransferase family 39 protein [Fischerella sp. JS2]|uniref:ArnT family glycosyltransferase n=1 Tax=Fischerella sp. JS2 TaxID=2597771 RepID=UPI0028EBE6A2|nr:glycosyltransferase family 39 protein [Fischerella sp. JS2]